MVCSPLRSHFVLRNVVGARKVASELVPGLAVHSAYVALERLVAAVAAHVDGVHDDVAEEDAAVPALVQVGDG